MDEGPPPRADFLLLENRSLRQKLMRIQNLFMQLLIACYSQPNNIGPVLGDIQQVLNESAAAVEAPRATPPGAGGPALLREVSHPGAVQLAPSYPGAEQQLVSPPQQQSLLTPLMPYAEGPGPSGPGPLDLPSAGAVAGPSSMISLPGGAAAAAAVGVFPGAEILTEVPPKPFKDYLSNIEEIWREYKYGDKAEGKPSIQELDHRYGDKWRKKEYVRESKELKSRQNLYNKRKCVWVEVQRFMDQDGLSEKEAVEKLQNEVNEFGKGLSRFIDTVLRERQKGRRGGQGERGSESALGVRKREDFEGDEGDDGEPTSQHEDKRQTMSAGGTGPGHMEGAAAGANFPIGSMSLSPAGSDLPHLASGGVSSLAGGGVQSALASPPEAAAAGQYATLFAGPPGGPSGSVIAAEATVTPIRAPPSTVPVASSTLPQQGTQLLHPGQAGARQPSPHPMLQVTGMPVQELGPAPGPGPGPDPAGLGSLPSGAPQYGISVVAQAGPPSSVPEGLEGPEQGPPGGYPKHERQPPDPHVGA